MNEKDFYGYFEERPLSNIRGTRRRKTSAVKDPNGLPVRDTSFRSSFYLTWYYELLEGPERFKLGDHREAAWAMTALRIARYVGDPGQNQIPDSTVEIRAKLDAGESPPAPASLGKRLRTHHYYRVLSANELSFAKEDTAVSLSIEVTEEWHDPSNGIISPIARDSEILGTHSISIVNHRWAQQILGFNFPNSQGFFIFQNSWGDEWGYQGWGAISPYDVDRFMAESFGQGPLGRFPPLETKDGLVIVLWKCSCSGKEVHGREIINAASGERIGWCFLVRRGQYLDIDELFVWPTHRQNGYGTILADLAKEAAQEMGVQLRALIGFVDAYPVDRARLERVLARLGLNLHPSNIRSLAYIGLEQACTEAFGEPRFPNKPAAPMYKLDPATATRHYTVWFGTNRKPRDSANLSLGFTAERDSQVRYGFCQVSIPKSHQFGSVGSPWYKRWPRGNDDRLKVVNTQGIDSSIFWRTLSERLSELEHGQRQGLVFLHGYYNSFEDAAIRSAQVGYDLRFPGETAFFSWPSAASFDDYTVDEAAIEASEGFIAQFLIDFAKKTQVEKLHVIAHSMGNRGLLRALQSISSSAEQSGVRFGQIILAAPDIDCDTFRRLADVYPKMGDRTTLYQSPGDRAVAASKWLHKYPRVGLTPPTTVVAGVDTVEVPKFEFFDVLGHSYYAEAEGLLHDMHDLIRHNSPPESRQRLLQAATADGHTYWTMER